MAEHADMRAIGLIGLGEVGRGLAMDLLAAGRRLRALDTRRHASSARAAATLGIPLDASPRAFASAAQAIVSAVPGRVAREVAELVLPFVPAGCIFVDLSARSVQARDGIAEACASRGVLYADCALTGTVLFATDPVDVLVSGPGSRGTVELLAGTRWQPLLLGEAPIGTEVKLCRSSFTKGLIALLYESLVAAERLGVGAPVGASLDALLGPTFARLRPHLLTSTVRHAGRRGAEVQAAAALVTQALGRAPMSRAAADVLAAVERQAPALPQTTDVDALLAAMARVGLFGEDAGPSGGGA